MYEERSPDDIFDSDETTVKEVVSSRRRAYSTRRSIDDCEAEGDEARNDRVEMQPAQNEMLTYITYYYQRNSIDVIKKTVSQFYTLDEIITAKTLLWQLFADMLLPERRRVTSDKRSAYDASLADIVAALGELDIKGNFPVDTFVVKNLDRLPKFAPEKTNVIAVMGRLRAIELQLNEVQDLSISNRDRIISNRDTMDTMREDIKIRVDKQPYNSVVVNGITRNNTARLQRTYSNNNVNRQWVPATVDVQQRQLVVNQQPVAADTHRHVDGTRANTEYAMSTGDNEQRRSPGTEDNKGDYDIQPRERRRIQRRQNKGFEGTRPVNGKLREAQAPRRDIFVYRVEKEVTDIEIETYANENGVKLRNVKVVAHNEAKLKSFKLTVSIKDMPTVLDAAFWPQGVMVRRYR